MAAASDDSLIYSAAKDGDLETVRQLVANGVDVNRRDSWDKTPLHLQWKKITQILYAFW